MEPVGRNNMKFFCFRVSVKGNPLFSHQAWAKKALQRCQGVLHIYSIYGISMVYKVVQLDGKDSILFQKLVRVMGKYIVSVEWGGTQGGGQQWRVKGPFKKIGGKGALGIKGIWEGSRDGIGTPSPSGLFLSLEPQPLEPVFRVVEHLCGDNTP